MPYLQENVHNVFGLSLNYSFQLRNIETDATMIYYTQVRTSLLFMTLEEADEYPWAKEDIRLQQEEVNGLNTRWSFVRFVVMNVKLILHQQALRIGAGTLLFWLRHKKGMYALEQFDNDLCLFCWYAVHKGARINRRMRATKRLVKEFFGEAPHTPYD